MQHFRLVLLVAFAILVEACARSGSEPKSARHAEAVRIGQRCANLENLANDTASNSFFEVAELNEQVDAPFEVWIRSKPVQAVQVAGLLSAEGAATEAPWATPGAEDTQIRIAPRNDDHVRVSLLADGNEIETTVVTAHNQRSVLVRLGERDIVVTRYRLGSDRRRGLSLLAQCRRILNERDSGGGSAAQEMSPEQVGLRGVSSYSHSSFQ